MGGLRKQLKSRGAPLAVFLAAGVFACALAGTGRETYELTDGKIVETITCFEEDPYALLGYSEQFSEETYYIWPTSEDGFERSESGAVQLPVHQKFAVQLTADGQTTEVLSGVSTVQSVLQENGIAVGEDDVVKPGLHKPVAEACSIQVIRVTSEVTEQTVKLKFQTEETENNDLEYGKKKTVQKGQNGKKWQKVQITYYDGKEHAREVLEEKILEQPVTQIVEKGTARMIDGHRYREKYTMEATAYHSGSITALGFIGYEGVVAVDPDIIPLGSRVYIPGYGEGYAADTGGSIQGHRIDLCMASHQRIYEFGRRNITVYLLE